MFGFLKHRRRKKIKDRPFPRDWLDILRRNVSYYSRLSDDEQRRLQDHIKVFLSEKRFAGCGGLAITDEIRITVLHEIGHHFGLNEERLEDLGYA